MRAKALVISASLAGIFMLPLPTIGQVGQTIRIEAESGTLSGFTIMGPHAFFSDDFALHAPSAPAYTATYSFSGWNGAYDVYVGYCDEDDGTSSYTLSGSAAGTIAAWQGDLPPVGTNNCSSTSLRTRKVASSVVLEPGETITLECLRDPPEPCRVDYFDFTYVEPLPTEHTLRIEAESGALSGFTVMGPYGFFSDDFALQAPSSAPAHTATYTFSGWSGAYDVSVGYCDEDDGTSSYTLSGSAAETIAAWQGDLPPVGTDNCSPTSLRTREVATSVVLEQGETITLECLRDPPEPCRVDYFDFTYVGGLPTGEHTVEFVATEDAYVSATEPDVNYGAASTLNTAVTPERVSYLKFDVSLPPGATVSDVKLHLHTTTSQSETGVAILTTETSWSEMSLTYTDRPASGDVVGATGGWSTPGWKEATLSTVARHSGTWGIAVHTAVITAVPTTGWASSFDSRETTNRPKLIVTYSVSGADPVPDCIGEPPDHPIIAYGQPRVFLEAQSWWGERLLDGSVPKYGDAEHLHIGACFPVQQTVSGTIRLDFRVVAHNAPLGSLIESTRFHDFDFDGSGPTVHEFDWNIPVDEVNEIGWHTIYVDTTEWPDGLREARPFTKLSRPDGAEIHTSASWCWNVQNGQPDSDAPLCNREVIQGRGWYDCFEYKIAETAFWEYPYEGVIAGTDHFLRISGADGAPAGGEFDPKHYVRLNPNFHANQGGLHLLTHDGEHWNEPLTIDGSLLTPGVHALFVMTEDMGLCEEISPDTGFPNQIVPQDGEISGGIRVPILVLP